MNAPRRGAERGRSLTGRLLVATPRTGGSFHRTVVLVLQHGIQGAHGVVLNRPLDAPVSVVLGPWQDHATAPGVLFRGGPVGQDTAMGLVSVPGEPGDVLGLSVLFRGVGVVDLDAPPELVVPEISALRIFVGYAGWSPGQLEEELAHGAWSLLDAEARDPFQPDVSHLWQDVLLRQRNSLSLLVTHTDHPERN